MAGDEALASAAEEAAAHIDVTRARVARRSQVREMIFGTQDGLLTTLGLVTAVGGATAERYSVLVAGLAGAVAGMIAMGAGAYISSKAQAEVHEAEVDRERRELMRNPERELEELVTLFEEDGLPQDEAREVAVRIARHPRAMLRAMAQKEMGLALEASRPLREGVVMGFAFAIGAAVPILPWIFASTTEWAGPAGARLSQAILLSIAATLVVLFLMGAGKSRLAHGNVVVGGLEVAGVGVAAAALGFVAGTVLPSLFGVHSPGS